MWSQLDASEHRHRMTARRAATPRQIGIAESVGGTVEVIGDMQ
jgi:hypothetical protein